MRKVVLTVCLSVLACSTNASADRFHDMLGPRFSAREIAPARNHAPKILDAIHRWNEIAINASGLDHTPVAAGETRIFGEQIGPGRASRAMAIVHIAMFDAINAPEGQYRSYTGIEWKREPVSIEAAFIRAAHDTLVALYPSQASSFDAALAADLLRLREGAARHNGIRLGRRVAAAVLAMRSNDGVQIPEPRLGIDIRRAISPAIGARIRSV